MEISSTLPPTAVPGTVAPQQNQEKTRPAPPSPAGEQNPGRQAAPPGTLVAPDNALAAQEASGPAETDEQGLSQEEQALVAELSRRDTAVRAHERAHKAAAGAYAGAVALSYTTGPDGQRYATGGEVPIDIAPIPGDPAATIQKLSQVKRAALAPADPSGADRSIAAAAAAGIAEARTEQIALRKEETQPAEAEAPTTTADAALGSHQPGGQNAGKSDPAPFSISV
jgi:hypothetical protein